MAAAHLTLRNIVCLLGLAGACASLGAAVRLPSIFSDHAVLQRGAAVPVWGKAAAGERVKVTVAGKSAEVAAEDDGKWRVQLDLSAATEGPHQLVIEGSNRVVVDDVVIGEVWLGSGQSNMEWMLSGADDKAVELARPRNPRLREFTVKRSMAAEPRDDCEGRWRVAGPDTSAEFSALGYHFSRILLEKTQAAVGVINASWGGTPIEYWLSAETIAADVELAAAEARIRKKGASFAQDMPAYVARGEAWSEEFAREDRHPLEPKQWRTVTISEGLAEADLPKSGAIWLRRTVRVPEQIETIGLDRGFLVSMGVYSGFDQLYWNGVKVGETSWKKPPAGGTRRYPVPSKFLQPGKEATIALRIFNPLDTGFALNTQIGAFSADTVDLRGEWQVGVEFELPALSAAARTTYPRNVPRAAIAASRMFNGLIAPLVGYKVRGFIWYQGESNTPRAAQYERAFPALINDWRRRWGDERLPFYFCQLANAKLKRSEPGDSTWAELREAQARALSLPATGMAVLIDIGEEADDHPRNKREAAERLARLALADIYKQPVVARGPTFESVRLEGAVVRVSFRDAEGGLVARPLPERYQPRSTQPGTKPLARHSSSGAIEGFALCGSDDRWHWADTATIDGAGVRVQSRHVPAPVAVRYAWADNPTCNLYNGAGLPAVPFRTDHHRRITENEKY